MKRYLNTIFPSTAAAGAPATAAGDLGRPCPSCGTSAAAEQDWCLECGTRIGSTGARWHQPAAVMASVALIFVAGLALALSEVAKKADIAGAKTVKKTVAATPPPAPATSTPDIAPPTAAPKSTKSTDPGKVPSTSNNSTDDNGPAAAVPAGAGTNAGSSPDPFGDTGSADAGTSSGSTSGGGGGSSGSTGAGTTTTSTPEPVAEWPADKSAWTVVLDSTTSRTDAEKIARKAKAKGIDAGILDSSKFAGQGAGVWVIYGGQFATEGEATKASDDYASKGFEGDRIDHLKPKPKGTKTKSRSGTTSTASDEG